MKTSVLLLLSLLLLAPVLPAFKSASGCSVNYNGIYAFKLDNEHSAVIRFYEDGTVLASTSVNDYMDVFTWFHKENKEMVLNGKYKIRKCTVSFSVKGATGEQYYSGDITGETIRFRLTDEDSKKATLRTYSFYAL